MLMFSSVLDACDRQAFLPHDFLDVGAPVLEPPQIVGNQVIFSAAWRQTLVADAEVRVDGCAAARTIAANNNNTALVGPPRKHFVISGAANAAGEGDRQARLRRACAHAVGAEIGTRGTRERGREAAREGHAGGRRRARLDMQAAQGRCCDTREVT